MRAEVSKNQKKTVFVMLSGGVDSSVAAYLLKKQGYKVTGVFMRNWSNDSINYQLPVINYQHYCSWRRDQSDARQVAKILGIPFYTFNFERDYRKLVVDYLKAEYAAGRTPNPDVMCNSAIKFGLFLDKAKRLGADFVATGHYARLRREIPSAGPLSRRRRSGNSQITKLLRARDERKDQSYFLWQLNQDQLNYSLFPIGELSSKQEVRRLAQKAGLPTYNKRDSQGICFIGKLPVRQFLIDTLGKKPGEIIRITDNKLLGTHRGAYLYTRGQRQGLGIGGGIPHYVVETDINANKVLVAEKKQEAILYDTMLIASNLNWVGKQSPKLPLAVKVRIRHGQPLQPAIVRPLGPSGGLADSKFKQQKSKMDVTMLRNIVTRRSAILASRVSNRASNKVSSEASSVSGASNKVSKVQVVFNKPQRAITPGQSVVFYKGQELLGGGIIDLV